MSFELEIHGEFGNRVVRFEDRSSGGTDRLRVTFANGYGISIIRGWMSYGGESGLFEIGVLKDDRLCYDTPITDDVIGYLSVEEVMEYARKISEL